MRIRRLLVSGLLVGLTLGVGAPMVSAAPATSTTESCDYVMERYKLTYGNYVKHRDIAIQLRRQADAATGAEREQLLARASSHQKIAYDNFRWSEARRVQLREQCDIYIVPPGIRMSYSS